jgi:hypothetical protein
MSHAAVAGDIPGLAFGANRLSRAIARSLFLAGAEKLQAALHAHDDREPGAHALLPAALKVAARAGPCWKHVSE